MPIEERERVDAQSLLQPCESPRLPCRNRVVAVIVSSSYGCMLAFQPYPGSVRCCRRWMTGVKSGSSLVLPLTQRWNLRLQLQRIQARAEVGYASIPGLCRARRYIDWNRPTLAYHARGRKMTRPISRIERVRRGRNSA